MKEIVHIPLANILSTSFIIIRPCQSHEWSQLLYVLALDLPPTVKSAQPAAFGEYAKKICMDTITYLGTPQKIRCGVEISNCNCITYHLGFS